MIGRFKLGKTLYSIFVLHSRRFWSVVDPWFFTSLEVFHVNSNVVSLSLILLFISCSASSYLWNFRHLILGWMLRWNKYEMPLDNLIFFLNIVLRYIWYIIQFLLIWIWFKELCWGVLEHVLVTCILILLGSVVAFTFACHLYFVFESAGKEKENL